jgi:hypothetical protein
MAFQQPQQRPAPLRQISPAKQNQERQQLPASPARKRTIEESQEWILFSPAQNDEQSRTSQTPRTATQLSDFGSLETHIRSQPLGVESQDNDLTCQGTEVDDDGAELDSLDDGLHAFHHNPFSGSSINLDHSGGTVLPTHDGFGTFPSSAGLQEQLWQFERYNPQRKKHVRRRSSVQKRLDALAEEQDIDIEDERTARIEKWRLEQSKAVLEEIEKETKRRRRRLSRLSTSMDLKANRVEESAAQIPLRDTVIHEESESETRTEEQPATESFWKRITRKVIRDLIGLDENTLSVIFGESLPEEATPTPTQPSPIAVATASPPESRVTFDDPGYSWEIRLLNHIARELGVLVHQLTEHDGRAFQTYLQTRETASDYAGLPVREPSERQSSLRQQHNDRSARRLSTDPLFAPTLSQPFSPLDAPDKSLWGIEEEPDDDIEQRLQQERAYWERDIDVNMIFNYLRRRFSQVSDQVPEASTAASGPLPASWATVQSASALGSSPESIRRAEVIRKHHPLVSRAAAAAQSHRRDSLIRRHQLQQLAQKRPSDSSCASQSTKRSRRTMSGSSRHYWLEGSVGSVGSGPAMSSGALGGWGEV